MIINTDRRQFKNISVLFIEKQDEEFLLFQIFYSKVMKTL